MKLAMNIMQLDVTHQRFKIPTWRPW